MLSPGLRTVLDAALGRARERCQAFCSCEQALETLLEHEGHAAAARVVTTHLDAKPRLPFDPPAAEFSRALRGRALPDAQSRAECDGRTEVAPLDLLGAFLGGRSPVSRSLREEVLKRLAREGGETDSGSGETSPVGPGGSRAPSARPDGILKEVKPREEDEHLVERQDLLDRLMMTLTFSNPLLVGSPGSGRRSVVKLLARCLAQGVAPPDLGACRLVEISPAGLVSGTTYRGEFEERVTRLMRDLERCQEPQVLVAPDLHLLAEAGAGGSGIDAASALVPYLQRGKVRLIGCTTHDVLREKLEDKVALLQCMTQVRVPTPTAEEAARLLEKLPARLERRHAVRLRNGMISLAIALCREHLPQLALPGAAERMLENAAATLAFEARMLERDAARTSSEYWAIVGREADRAEVGERHVQLALSRQHLIPLDQLDRGVRQKIDGLEVAFREQIFGQDHVLAMIHDTVKVALTKLSDPQPPRGRLFFLGPPGTGKTECARLLARHLMGSEDALLRFDMSEFAERSSISTLLGSDKGLVNSEEGGRLTEPLRQNPHCVILFDEIEKADRSVFNIFLQILDNGEIHDKRGCLVSFRHAICIFTSNAGCDRDTDLSTLSRAQIVERLGRVFRPEFLDRVEAFVPFRSLAAEARRKIAVFQLDRLAEQMRRAHHVELVWSDAVVEATSRPEDGEPGARHILRCIQRQVKPVVADALLADPDSKATTRRITLDLDESCGFLAKPA